MCAPSSGGRTRAQKKHRRRQKGRETKPTRATLSRISFFLGLDKLKEEEEEDHTLIGNTKNKTIAGRKKKKSQYLFEGQLFKLPTVCLSPLLW